MRIWFLPVAALVMAWCSSELDELKQFVKDSEKNLPRKIEPLPAVKPFDPFTYEGFDLPDPFKPRKSPHASRSAAGVCGSPRAVQDGQLSDIRLALGGVDRKPIVLAPLGGSIEQLVQAALPPHNPPSDYFAHRRIPS